MNKSKQNFEILNTFIDSISIIDNKGNIIYTNDAWKKFSKENDGKSSKTDSGVNYLQLCKKVSGEELQNAIEAAAGIEKVIKKKCPVFELEYPCHSHYEQRWFIMRANPLFSFPELTIISHINITKRKLAEVKVEKINNQLTLVNERLTTTTYKIVHDIQGPLNSIEGLVNLSKTDEQNKSISSYLLLMEKSISNLKNYIQETLKISALGSKIESVDLNDILNTFLDSIKHTTILKTIAIKMEVNQNHDFYTDKTEVASIISNLINNSLKYYDVKKTDPFVYISIIANEKEAIISIKDNGIGISKEIISHIFDLNFQANKKSNAGSGIGLFMVKESIKKLNGVIEVNSTLSEGTEFIITLQNLRGGK